MSPRAGLVALLTADVVSALGTRISLVAIPWLVLVTTGSPARMGLVAGAEMLPYVLSAVFATPLADRFGLRLTSVTTDVASLLAMAAIAATPELGFLPLVVLVAVAGAARGVGDRAKHVLLRPVAEAAGVRMIRVTALYEGLTRGATLVGAPLGGLLIFWFGARGAIWVDAASFAVCAVIVAGFVRPPARPAGAGDRREPYLVALRAGARYLRRDRLLAGMVVVTLVGNVFAQASTAVFVPLWVADTLGSPAALGLVLGFFAGGAVLGNAAFLVLATRLPRYATFAVGAVVGGAPRLLALGLSHSLPVVLTVTFVSGVAIAAVNPILGALLYERVPPDLQTRVFGLCAAVSYAGIPLGGVLGGLMATGVGLDAALLVAGVLCLALTAVPLLDVWRRRDETVGAPAVAPEPAAGR